MPESASMPTQPEPTARSTSASHDSPAATVTSTPPQVGSSAVSTSGLTPWVAMRTTRPGKPASATTRLLPPATRSTSCPASSAALTVPTSSASDVASTKRPAGPPSRSVVRSARRCGGPGGSCSGTDDGLGRAEHLLVAAGDHHRDRGEAVGGLTHRAGDGDLHPVVAVGHHDGLGELAADLGHPAGTGPALDGAADQGHGE